MSMSTRVKQINRLVVIYQAVKNYPEQTGRRLWEKLGIGKSQFTRDKQILEKMGFVFHYDAKTKRYAIDQDTGIPLASLPLDQCLSLFLFLGRIGQAQESYLSLSAKKAARQLLASSGQEIREICKNLMETEVIPPIYGCPSHILDRLRKSLARRERIIIEYSKPGSPAETYTIHPYQLYTYNGGLYLDAKCIERKQFRCFKACRITSVILTDLRFSQCKGYDFNARHRKSFGIFASGTPQRVRILFSPRAAPYIREEYRHPTQQFISHPDGSTTYEVCVTQPREVLWWAAAWAGEFEILEPGWLRDEAREAACKMFERHTDRSTQQGDDSHA